MQIDFIGDIHGHAEPLKNLLRLLGYRITTPGGAFRHPTRTAIFLGDLIDRGPQQAEVYRIVREMVEAGSALCIMGNHEYNVTAISTLNPNVPGGTIRERSDKNMRQHKEFFAQIEDGSDLHLEMVSWFRTLPLFLEEETFRAIHACWHPAQLQFAAGMIDEKNRLTEQGWIGSAVRGSPERDVVEILLKGTEIHLPEGCSYFDNDGTERKTCRTMWWKSDITSIKEHVILRPSTLETLKDAPADVESIIGYDGSRPLFVGHYWRTGKPTLLTPHVACLDYSIAKHNGDGKLCSYRWNGESTLSNDGFKWVGPEQGLQLG